MGGEPTSLSEDPPPRLPWTRVGGDPADAGRDRARRGRLLHASVLFRHGARGPGVSELRPFQLAAGGLTPAAAQWAPDDMEQLTETGEAQMAALGAWFRAEYLGAARDDARARELLGAARAPATAAIGAGLR